MESIGIGFHLLLTMLHHNKREKEEEEEELYMFVPLLSSTQPHPLSVRLTNHD